ncbi:DUF3459 domain-containing protein [Allosaccharopolyspora coralli]|uniref:DUF3459 domain-containing protein n=1 Tax=Allosaccharopolyspora coralli TaxID=2665642 RepID=A0A5Q3Q5R8_9PSEU|nr:alpha-amylase family glycosyl hydrolase [Allosaccharopolyspora coralli]QGK69170.1 DUF3459 domain-containing protein [Allosaccharopolyspora coralli]
MNEHPPDGTRRAWWHDTVFYRVDLRLFADSDGDGVGDLNGIRHRLGYLELLGVEALWLTGVVSEAVDGRGRGMRVDPVVGDLASLQLLATEAHESGMRLTIDLPFERDRVGPDAAAGFADAVHFWLGSDLDGIRVGTQPGMGAPADAVVQELVDLLRPVFDTYPNRGVGVVIDDWFANHGRSGSSNLVTDLRLGDVSFEADELRKTIERVLADSHALGSPAVWVSAGQALTRPVTRYGGGDLGRDRARAMALVKCALPGIPGLDNGEELALPDGVIPGLSETIVRSPMPWEGTEPPFGFSSAPGHWEATTREWAEFTVETQMETPDSTLSLYRTALQLRREIPGFTDNDDVDWYGAPSGCLAFQRGRGGPVCATNTSTTTVPLPPGEVLLSSRPLTSRELPPDTSVWLL